ncbi:MAG TPA: hypothetical protein VN915_17405 [Elusimicrobiota bacterium]|nr:hypothetical protein [Elusimicrobiota bacterium]
MFRLSRKPPEREGPVLAEEAQTIRVALVDALARRIGKSGRATPVVDGELDLLGCGLLDSLDLVEVIAEVEASARRRFAPAGLDFARGLTVEALLAGFVGVG